MTLPSVLVARSVECAVRQIIFWSTVHWAQNPSCCSVFQSWTASPRTPTSQTEAIEQISELLLNSMMAANPQWDSIWERRLVEVLSNKSQQLWGWSEGMLSARHQMCDTLWRFVAVSCQWFWEYWFPNSRTGRGFSHCFPPSPSRGVSLLVVESLPHFTLEAAGSWQTSGHASRCLSIWC